MNKSTQIAIAKYGKDKCVQAYELTLDGSGAGYVVACMGVHYRSADAMINAGREVAEQAEEDSWNDACDQMREDEGRWVDQGCSNTFDQDDAPY